MPTGSNALEDAGEVARVVFAARQYAIAVKANDFRQGMIWLSELRETSVAMLRGEEERRAVFMGQGKARPELGHIVLEVKRILRSEGRNSPVDLTEADRKRFNIDWFEGTLYGLRCV